MPEREKPEEVFSLSWINMSELSEVTEVAMDRSVRTET